MGVVYEAVQLDLKRPVALKILPPAMRFDKQLLRRFRREAEAAGRLRHPNIVPVYSTGEAGGAPFFAMELVEGQSLAQLIAAWKGRDDGAPDSRAGFEPPSFGGPEERARWCVELVARVLDALDHAHEEGIIHRDVKPGNILVEADGTPRLTDFGLALDTDASELTVAGEVFGSPLYMSPEQALRANTPLDARSDVYSVAVTLYELLTLRLPYEGTSRAMWLGALAEGRIVAPRSANPDISPALEATLLRALEVEPARRFPRAADFALALRDALVNPETVPDGAAKARKARKRLVPLLAFAGIVAAGLLAGRMLWPEPEPELERANAAAAAPATGEAPALTEHDLELLTDGRHPEGASLLERWLAPARFEMRDVVSRAEDTPCRFVWPHVGPVAGVWMGARLQFSIDGGPWVGDEFTTLQFAPPEDDTLMQLLGAALASAPGTTTTSLARDVHDILGASLARDHLTLRARMTLRIQPLETATTGDAFHGTEAHWTAVRTLRIVDEYPDDYPTPVRWPKHAAAMRAGLVPSRVTAEVAGGESPGIRVTGPFPDPLGGPVPGAFVVALLVPGLDEPLGTTELVTPVMESAGKRAPRSLRFSVAAEPAEAVLQALHELREGRVDSVHLRFQPSAGLARREPTLGEYWAAPIDVDVPVGE